MNNDFNVNARIKQLCAERNITYYELAKRSDIPYSTLSTMLHKSNQPSLITLRKICDGLEITLSHFFNIEGESVSLTEAQNEYLSLFNLLNIEEQKLAIAYMKGMLHKL
jgi:transcriptional regulator with XRE-family HTH domain